MEHNYITCFGAKWRRLLTLIMVVFMTSASLYAQDIKFTGEILDPNNTPIIGATVASKATGRGAVSGVDGKFTISVPRGSEVVFSYMGHKDQVMKVNNDKFVTVKLVEDAYAIEAVVSIGYGTARKSDLTGAVSSVSSQSLIATGAQTLEQALVGQAAGVTIEASDNAAGAASTIRIRGANSINGSSEPLYVVDGIPMMNSGSSGDGMSGAEISPIAGISPSDIESIDILKDASATAIYGSQGANGVIIINTKQGASNSMMTTVSLSHGIQTTQTDVYDVMDSKEYINYLVDYTYAWPKRDYLGQEFVNNSKYGEYVDMIANNEYPAGENWLDKVLRNGQTTSMSVDMTGGSKKAKYSASFSYYNNQGVVENTNLDRYTLRLNTSTSGNKRVNFGVNTLLSLIQNKGVVTSTSSTDNSSLGVMLQALTFNPTLSMYDEFGEILVYDPYSTSNQTNPYSNLMEAQIESNYTNINVRGFMSVKLAKDLSLKIQGGGNINNKASSNYYPVTSNWGRSKNGRSINDNTAYQTMLGEAILNYSTKIKQHRISAMLGTTVNMSSSYRTYMTNENFAIGSLGTDAIHIGTNPSVSSTSMSNSLASALARVQYSYADKYSLTTSFRADGSSKVAKDNRWGYFPSLAAAWRLSNEDFLKDAKYLSNLKLRAGYGITGNQNIPAYQQYNSYNVSLAVIDGSDVLSTTQTTIANPDLKWETTTAYNVGADIGFFKGRLTSTLDFYHKRTEDLLLKAIVPSTAGIPSSTTYVNLGAMENTGAELSISSVNVEKPNFRWSTTFNIATNKNVVVDLGNNDMIQVAGSTINMMSVLQEGQPIGLWYGLVTDGLWQQSDFTYSFGHEDGPKDANGNPMAKGWNINPAPDGRYPASFDTDEPGAQRYKDLNDDGVIDDEDKMVIGKSQAKFNGSLMNSFKYKNFDMNVNLEFSYGKDVVNGTKWQLVVNGSASRNKLDINSWTPNEYAIREDAQGNPIEVNTNVVMKEGNTSSHLQKASACYAGSTPLSDIYVEDGSYLRLKSLTIGYTLPKVALAKLGVKNARVYFNAANLLTITGYSGYDPSVNTSNLGGLRLGYDFNAYPIAKSYTLGLNVSF